MKTKQGRNEACFCGSGKKYKQCCAHAVTSSQEVINFAWVKLRKTEGRVIDNHLVPYFMKQFNAEDIQQLVVDIVPETLIEHLDEAALIQQFFLPWVLFNWIPEQDDEPSSLLLDETVAKTYLRQYKNRLDKDEQAFIVAMSKSYYSFYSVIDVIPEEALIVKDIFLHTEHTVRERQGTRGVKRGDIIFSRLITQNAQTIFVGMAPYIIPGNYHHKLIGMREGFIKANDNIALNDDILRHDLEAIFIDCFFEILDEKYNQPMPTFCNTDGDIILFSTSYFRLDFPLKEAIKQLLPLSLTLELDELLDNAEFDANHQISRIAFPWLKKGNKTHKSWANTVMGHLTLEPGRLILQTNSEKRTRKGKALLKKYLGNHLVFQHTLLETPEQKLKALPAQSHQQSPEDDLMALPQVQEFVVDMANAHWESWFNDRIPALDNKTPRQAAKTALGREQLEALLLHYESTNQLEDNNPFKADIQFLRKELGL